MATKGSGTHTGYWAISGRVLTIRTIGWKTIAQGRGCDTAAESKVGPEANTTPSST